MYPIFDANVLALPLSNQIVEICSPLFQAFSIKFFRYLRVFQDGSRIEFCSDASWTENFYKQGHYNIAWYDAKKIVSTKIIKLLWDEKARNKEDILGIEAKEHFNLFHGMSLLIPSKEYYEIFDFATEKKNFKINDIYLRNQDIFEHFCFYFRDKANVLIKAQEKNKIKIIELMKEWNNDIQSENYDKINHMDFFKRTNIDRFYINTTIGDIYFTKKEAECIYWITKGKSAEEIGLILGSSKKTIEGHINSIKNKIGCGKIIKIVELALKTNLLDEISSLILQHDLDQKDR